MGQGQAAFFPECLPCRCPLGWPPERFLGALEGGGAAAVLRLMHVIADDPLLSVKQRWICLYLDAPSDGPSLASQAPSPRRTPRDRHPALLSLPWNFWFLNKKP